MTTAMTPSEPIVDVASSAIASTGSRQTAGEKTTSPMRFPTEFVWGAATSSFQIEGGRAGRDESIWDRFCAIPGAIVDGSNGDIACGHHEHAATDVRLMSKLGLGAYRFSISWPRVIPGGRGEVAPSGIDFYDRLVDQLLAAGIEPYVTLYHWDLPQALEDDGGWPERATAYHFAEYADAVAAALGDRVKHWATLNEPYCSSHFGYVTGFMAPGRTSVAEGFAAAHHLLLGHGLAVERLRSRVPEAEVGIVLNFNPMHPASEDPADVAAAAAKHALHNRWFAEPVAGLGYPIDDTGDDRWSGAELHDGDLDIIAAPIDVLGVNYYSRALVNAADERIDPPGPVTAMGWEIYPQGLGETVRWLHDRCQFPRYLITENGAAMDDHPDASGFVDDQDRIA
jgi:beta-glucosidase